jgi:type II secretory pathway predicted ATPase ExeA
MTTLVDQDSLRPVIVIDEAHDMRPDVLAVLRVLTNFEMDSKLVVSLVLCGQPPLRRSSASIACRDRDRRCVNPLLTHALVVHVVEHTKRSCEESAPNLRRKETWSVGRARFDELA